jgi:hypothetical protein
MELKRAFAGTSLRKLFQSVVHGKYKPPSDMYSKQLKYTLSRLLVVEPKNRTTVNRLLRKTIMQRRARDMLSKVGIACCHITLRSHKVNRVAHRCKESEHSHNH